MAKRPQTAEIGIVPAKSARERLIDATLDLIASDGATACSARRIGDRAGIAPSTINYSFGRIEQLFSSAYEQAAAQTEIWLDLRRQTVKRLPQNSALIAFVLEDTIRAWTGEQRDLALTYQDCHTAKASCLALWSGLFAQFWQETATYFGLATDAATLLHLQFEAEALYHLSQWDKTLEAAALRESCSYFARQWLKIPAEPTFGATGRATELLASQPSWSGSPTAGTIARAAAVLVGEEGLAGLTHRAVASRAAATLGAVTYHFPTIEALVAGAVWGQILAIPGVDHRGRDRRNFSSDLTDPGVFATVTAIANNRRNLFLAGIRRPDLAAPCATIRFAHGGTSRAMATELDTVSAAQQAVHASVGSKLICATTLLVVEGTLADPRAVMAQVLRGFAPQV